MGRNSLAGSVLLLVLTLSFCPYALAQSAEEEGYSHIRIIRLSLVRGQVFLARADDSQARKAVLNDPVGHGATLATVEGIAEVELESDAVVRLAENSRLAMTELGLRGNGGRVTHLALAKGTATFYVKLRKADGFLVATPQLRVSVPKRAQFRLDVYNNESAVVVRKGEVTLDAHGSEVTLTKGESAAIRAEETSAIQVARAPKRDEWDRWTDRRQDTTEIATSRSYLPAHLTYGASALDAWGLWFFYPRYGHVWQPYAAAGWSPFFDGFWDWVPGLGYTWISYEPWGWLPYHYGRWLLTPYGWAWVPGYFGWFSPGTVYWINCGNYVGWAPQQPGSQPPTAPAPGGTLPPGTVINTPKGVATGGPNTRPKKDVEGLDLTRATFMDRLAQTPEMRELAMQSAARQTAARTVGPQPPASPEASGRFLYDPRERRFISNPRARESDLASTRESARERAPGVLMAPGLLKATEERRSGVKMPPSQEAMPRAEGRRDFDRGELGGRGGSSQSPEAARPPASPRPSGEPQASPPPSPPPPSRPASPGGAPRPSSPTRPRD